MNELIKVFEFEGSALRVLGTPDKPLFVAAEVCRALGINNHRMAVAHFPDRLKGVSLTDGSGQQTIVITEAGLYRLVMRSRKPSALRFQEVVTETILPAIRETGNFLGNKTRLLWEAYRIARTGAVQLEILRQMGILSVRPAASIPSIKSGTPGDPLDLVKLLSSLLAAMDAGAFGNSPEELRKLFKVRINGAGNPELPESQRAAAFTRRECAWISRLFYFKPGPVLEVLRLRGLAGELRDLRTALMVHPGWVAPPAYSSMHKQVFTGRGSENCWCLDADKLGALGYTPVTDDVFREALAAPTWRDPRKGRLFTLLDRL